MSVVIEDPAPGDAHVPDPRGRTKDKKVKADKRSRQDRKDDDRAGLPALDRRGGSSRGRRTSTAAETSVNLLSPWALEELHVYRLRVRFAVGALALLLVLAGSWGLLRKNLSGAEEGLRGEQAIAQELQGQITELGAVRDYIADVKTRTADVEDTMSQEVAMSKVLRALDEALPDGAAYESIDITLPPATIVAGADAAEAPTCPGPDPFEVRTVVGCVVIAGTAGSRYDVGQLVQALAASKFFVEPFVDTTTTNTSEGAAATVSFNGSLGLSEATLTGRYADLDGSGDEPDQGTPTDGSER